MHRPISSRDAPNLRIGGQNGYLRIATEEAFAPAEVLCIHRAKLAEGSEDIGFMSLMGTSRTRTRSTRLSRARGWRT
jgi:hypothetical protein